MNRKLSILSYIALFLLLIVVNSCDPTASTKFLPILTTNEITQITQNTAACGGNISSDGGFEVTARGVCWSLKPNPTVDDNLTKSAAGTGMFICSISNLIADTTYYVRAYATNKDGTAYGLQITFKTLKALLPALTTAELTDITTSSAITGGNITYDGGSPVTARGVCWSITANPTITNDKTFDGNGIGIYSSNLTNLTTGSTYYIKAYASNSVGTAYGLQCIFKTLSVPHITTLPVAWNTTTAKSVGNIDYDGGSPVTARGICWSTSINPTISDNITTDGTGIGTFASNITSLTEKTTYYLRAYAINSIGTAYGDIKTFITYGYTSIVGSWHCSESTIYGSKNYLVDIDRKRTDTTQFLLSNFYNQGDNEFIYAHLNGSTLTISQQQIVNQIVKSGTGIVSSDFKTITFDCNIYDGSSEIKVHSVCSR